MPVPPDPPSGPGGRQPDPEPAARAAASGDEPGGTSGDADSGTSGDAGSGTSGDARPDTSGASRRERRSAGGSRQDRRPAPARSRSRRAVLIGAVALIVVIVAVMIFMAVNQRGDAPEPPAPVTTTLSQPTPVGEPIDVSGDSPLAQGIPQVVLDHVLTAQEEDDQAYPNHGALEGWFLTYSAPGSDIEVHLLQWEEGEEAAAFVDDLMAQPPGFAEGEGRRSGDVAVEGEPVGRYEIGVLSEQDEPATPSTDRKSVVEG